jgi:hypothetical protein
MESPETIFEKYWYSGLHYWPKPYVESVYSVISVEVTVNGFIQPDIVTEKNFNGVHSEVNAIRRLQEIMKTGLLPSQTQVWYINFSPCRDCSDQLANFLTQAKNDDNVRLSIDMRFPFLYEIQRPSCRIFKRSKSCSKFHRTGRCVHKKNLEGLRKLRSCGVTLQGFEEKDWHTLAGYLNLDMDLISCEYEYTRSHRQEVDRRLQQDICDLLGRVPTVAATFHSVFRSVQQTGAKIMDKFVGPHGNDDNNGSGDNHEKEERGPVSISTPPAALETSRWEYTCKCRLLES